MANNYLDTSLVDKAIKFAVDAHSGTERRGKGFPYVIHVLEAMEIAATITKDPEIIAAAALHDTVEDTDVTLEQIRKEFGQRIADLVAAESETPVPEIAESDSWHMRKQAAIDRLANTSRDGKIVAMGDKLSNMRAICRDFRKDGDRLWNIFHAPNGRPDHEWHYRGLAEALNDLAGTDAYTEFMALIEEVFGAITPEPVDMDNYVLSGEGYTAQSYDEKNGSHILKLYSKEMPASEPKKELTTAWAVMEMGLSTPRAVRLVTDGERTGVEFEKVTGKRSFARAMSQEPEKIRDYAVLFAKECKKLHSTPCNTTAFESAHEKYKGIVNLSPDFSDAEKEKMITFVNSVPKTKTCLHGDLHIGNILEAGGSTYWIDLADFCYGNPMFDLGMTYFSCWCNTDEDTMNQFHLHNEQMQEFWGYFEKEYFGADADHEEIKKKCAPFVALQMAYFGIHGDLFDGMKEYITENLINI